MENIIKSLFRIKNINYEAIDLEIPEGELLVGYEDIVENFTMFEKNGEATFEVTRVVNFDPKVLYTLAITLEVKIIFEPDTKIELEYIKRNAKDLVESTSGLASLVNLIANITSAQGNPPVITPPQLTYTYK